MAQVAYQETEREGEEEMRRKEKKESASRLAGGQRSLGAVALLLVGALGLVLTSPALAQRRYVCEITGAGSASTSTSECDKSAPGLPAGQFKWPAGLAVDGSDDLWVSDDHESSTTMEDEATIDKFSAAGEFLLQGVGKAPNPKSETKKEKEELEEANAEGKVAACTSNKTNRKIKESLATKYWTGKSVASIAFSAASGSGSIYIGDGKENQLWVMDNEACVVKNIFPNPFSEDVREKTTTGGGAVQVAADDSSQSTLGDIYVSSGSLVYRLSGELPVGPEGEGICAPFSFEAEYIVEEPCYEEGGKTKVSVKNEAIVGGESPAVSPLTGDLYTVTGAGYLSKVEINQYEPSGELIRHLSSETADGHYIQGIDGVALAVDPVTGDLLVGGPYEGSTCSFGTCPNAIEEFSPSGVYLGTITNQAFGFWRHESEPEDGLITGLAVNSLGDLYVADGPAKAVYELGPYEPSLEVIKGGTGSGTVTSSLTGIDCGTECSAGFTTGSEVTLTEKPEPGSTFTGWQVEPGADVHSGCTGEETTCTVQMNEATKVTATFKAIPVELEVIKEGSGSGTVTSSPTGIDCGTECSASFPELSEVTLSETPQEPGSIFTGWQVEQGVDVHSGCTGTETTCTVTMNGPGPVRVTATFEPSTAAFLDVKVGGSGTGTVIGEAKPGEEPPAIECPTRCSATFTAGNEVKLTETPEQGSAFTGWEVEPGTDVKSGCTGAEPTCTVTMNEATDVTATFTPKLVTLEVLKDGTGSGTVTSSPSGIDCGTECSASFDELSTVTLTQERAPGSVFTGWQVEHGTVMSGCTGAETTCTVTMNEATDVTATFGLEAVFALEVLEPGLGSGTVTSSPAGIECPGALTCSADFAAGSEVKLTETPASGSRFTYWQVEPGAAVVSGCGGVEETCTVRMSGATTVTAMFAPIVDDLEVAVRGTGMVESRIGAEEPGPIRECTANGGTCAAEVQEGTEVTLMERPGEHQRFAGWTGACEDMVTCTVTVSHATSVGATFEPILVPLTVKTNGTGSGTITSSPEGIACGATCSANLEEDTSVTLTASAAAGSTFAGWSGEGGCTGRGACTVTLAATTTVTATFTVEPAKETPATTTTTTTTGPPPPPPPPVPPSNAFKALVGHRGTVVTLELTLPGAGDVAATGRDLVGATAHPGHAGALTLELRLTKTGEKVLRRTGKLTTRVTIAYTPTGGTTATLAKRITLRLATRNAKKHG